MDLKQPVLIIGICKKNIILYFQVKFEPDEPYSF